MDSTIALLSEDQHQLVYNALSFGTAVMLGAFVYFLTQMSAVNKEYRPAVAASAVVVGIAGYHYYRIWEGFSNGEMNEGYLCGLAHHRAVAGHRAAHRARRCFRSAQAAHEDACSGDRPHDRPWLPG